MAFACQGFLRLEAHKQVIKTAARHASDAELCGVAGLGSSSTLFLSTVARVVWSNNVKVASKLIASSPAARDTISLVGG